LSQREFVYFLWAYLLRNAVSYAGEILHTDTRRSCEGHVLGSMSIKVVVTKKWHFSQKLPACRRSATINSTGRVWSPGCILGRCVSAVQSFTKSSCSGPRAATACFDI